MASLWEGSCDHRVLLSMANVRLFLILVLHVVCLRFLFLIYMFRTKPSNFSKKTSVIWKLVSKKFDWDMCFTRYMGVENFIKVVAF